VRSGIAAAQNYAEARNGESLRDFVHKLRIVRKELHASYIWLRMLRQADLGDRDRLEALLKESDELCRIVSASKKTPETRLKNKQANPSQL
jgi:four helix bundle protein